MSDQKNTDPSITNDDKLWSLLAYVLSPIVPIIILLIEEKKNRPFIKAHNIQALCWGTLIWLLNVVFSGFIGWIIGLAGLVLSIIWGIKAFQGEYVNIPYLTDFLKKQGLQ